jgi:hypothetical protein
MSKVPKRTLCLSFVRLQIVSKMIYKPRAPYQYQKSVESLSVGFIGIVMVSPPVMFSIIVELVALVLVELSFWYADWHKEIRIDIKCSTTLLLRVTLIVYCGPYPCENPMFVDYRMSYRKLNR